MTDKDLDAIADRLAERLRPFMEQAAKDAVRAFLDKPCTPFTLFTASTAAEPQPDAIRK